MVVAALLMGTLPMQSVTASSEKEVSVKLKNSLGNKSTIPLEIQGSYVLSNDAKFKLNGSYQMALSADDKEVILKQNGKEKYRATSIKLLPQKYSVSNTIKVDKLKYLGEMEFVVEGKNIRPINTLPLEDYLKSVVHREMPQTWNLEALKAQAVSARTFAEVRINQVIDDTQNNQVYGGYDWGSSTYDRSSKAVEETRGETLTYNGNLVQTFYSSSNGGKIESNNGAWGSSTLPYLQAKKDPYDPQTVFEYDISENDLKAKVKSYTSVNIKTIESVKVSARTEGDYAQSIEFSVNQGLNTFTMKASDFRKAIGASLVKSTNIEHINESKKGFVIKGKGFGHGVGMSQHGANAMAKQGHDYKEILNFYYKNTSLKVLPYQKPIDKEQPITNNNIYSVKKGNTLYSIATSHKISVDDLKSWNNLKSNTISVGQKLIVSRGNGKPTVPNDSPKEETKPTPKPVEQKKPTSNDKTYIVKKGDTLYRIALNNKVNEANLKSWNKLKSNSISIGQKLIVSKGASIPSEPPKEVTKPTPKPVESEKPSQPATTNKTYKVKKGDTLFRIAANHKVSVTNLKSWNGLKSNSISVGQKLIVSKNTSSVPKSATNDGTKKIVSKKTGKVTASVLNVRSSGKTTSKIVGKVKKGNTVTITSTSGKWAKISYGKTVGFVHTDYLTNIKTTTTTVSDSKNKGVTAKTYIVKKGDTLYGISLKNGLSVSKIKADNGLKTNVLRIGQKLQFKA